MHLHFLDLSLVREEKFLIRNDTILLKQSCDNIIIAKKSRTWNVRIYKTNPTNTAMLFVLHFYSAWFYCHTLPLSFPIFLMLSIQWIVGFDNFHFYFFYINFYYNFFFYYFSIYHRAPLFISFSSISDIEDIGSDAIGVKRIAWHDATVACLIVREAEAERVCRNYRSNMLKVISKPYETCFNVTWKFQNAGTLKQNLKKCIFTSCLSLFYSWIFLNLEDDIFLFKF